MSPPSFKHNEIVVLLGAGASVDAGIPDSRTMIGELETLLSGEERWRQFLDLYRYVRSAVFYADGLKGVFDGDVAFNIERLVNVLSELHKKERHTLYPFVGAWNPKLLEVAGESFEHVQRFRSRIIEVLRKRWIALPRVEDAEYYAGLMRLQEEYGYPLRVFSLNYDLCVEQTCGRENVQMGFADWKWDWRLFDETSDDSLPLLLYKLHGSTDWYFDDDGKVTYSDSPSTIPDEKVALIFAAEYKLRYIDPFLFFAYELRRWTLDTARLIVSIGYGFNDDHINGILRQSLRQDDMRKLLVVDAPDICENGMTRRVADLLTVDQEQIRVDPTGAECFLRNGLSIEALAGLFPAETDLFPVREGGLSAE